MDKSQFDILSEIRQTLDSLKAQIAEIEAKLADIEIVDKEVTESLTEPVQQVQEAAAEDFADPIDISIDIDPFEPVPDPVQVEVTEEAPAVAQGTESVPAAEPEPAAVEEASPAPAPEPEPESVPEKPESVPAGTMFADEDMPEELLSPVESINDRQEKKSRKAVMDVMGAKCAWRTAIPGTPVKNVISAISLNDRVLFINTLFKEDPMAFQEAISAFNSMESFAEAEAYVRERHSDWNLNSDLVYRLMMAVRRKLK